MVTLPENRLCRVYACEPKTVKFVPPGEPALATTMPGDVEPSPQLIRAENSPAVAGIGLTNVATLLEKPLLGAKAIASPCPVIGAPETVAVLVSETDCPSSSRIVVVTE
jgi:hypothetical protein